MTSTCLMTKSLSNCNIPLVGPDFFRMASPTCRRVLGYKAFIAAFCVFRGYSFPGVYDGGLFTQ